MHKVKDVELEQGGDWAEVVSTQAGRLLGVPCATARLCRREGRRGSLSKNIGHRGYSLNQGATALIEAQVEGRIQGYVPHREGQPGIDPNRPGVRRPGHSLENIKEALAGYLPPLDFVAHSLTAFDVFAGYMTFDALVGNCDRHEENWAILWPELLTLPPRLAASFDHSNSLGFNLPESYCANRLSTPSLMDAWAAGGKAARFEHAGRSTVTLVDHAMQALRLCSKEGADWWYDRLMTMDLVPLITELRSGAVPEMSETSIRFASRLLELNLERLRDATQSQRRSTC